MTTIPASHVLRNAAALMGQPWESDEGPDTHIFGMLRSLFDARLAKAWQLEDWPDLTRTELRQWEDFWVDGTEYGANARVVGYADNRRYVSLVNANTAALDDTASWWPIDFDAEPAEFDGAATYGEGDVVFYPADPTSWYVCRDDATPVGTLPSDDTYWSAVSATMTREFQTAYDPDVPNATLMGQVLSVHAANPTGTNRRDRLHHERNSNGVNVAGDPGTAWFRFKLPRPQINGRAYDASAAYAADAQVYFDTGGVGDFYEAAEAVAAGQSPVTNPELWTLIEIPEFLAGYLALAMYADWLRMQGQNPLAELPEARAVEALGEAFDQQQPRGVRRLGFQPN